ncbi:Uncharacterized protein cmbei_8001020, partial [Cryptosporidium meleagridis]
MNNSNIRMRSMAKLIYILFDDRLSIYSNSLIDRIVEDTKNLSSFGKMIFRMDIENIQYLIPVLVKLMECNPEKVIKNLLGDKGLHLSRLLCEATDKKIYFEYILEFYLHILNNYPNQFGNLLIDNSDRLDIKSSNSKEELSMNILVGIEKMAIVLARSSKYSKSNNYHLSRNLDIDKFQDTEFSMSDLECMQEGGSIPRMSNFLVNNSMNENNILEEMGEHGERSLRMNVGSGSTGSSIINMNNNNNISYGRKDLMEMNELEEKRVVDGINMFGLLRNREEDDNRLMKKLIQFFKGFMLYKNKMEIFWSTDKEKIDLEDDELDSNIDSECKRNRWIMEGECFEVVHKIIEWIIELLRNSIEVELDNLALDCILEVFTQEKCCVHEEEKSEADEELSDLNINQKDSDDNSKNNLLEKNSANIELKNEDKSENVIFNMKPLNIKSKRVTFKRIEEIPPKKKLITFNEVDKNKLRVNSCMQGGSKSDSNTGIEQNKSCGKLCFHQIFVIKHGQYLLDIFLELFDDYLRKFGLNFIRRKSVHGKSLSFYDQSYKYIIDNEQQIEEVLYKIIQGINNISNGVAIQSCPRQIFALSWFMEFILYGFSNEESVLKTKPPVPLYGSSSMDLVMKAANLDQPLEHALLSISTKFSDENSQNNEEVNNFQKGLINQIDSINQVQVEIVNKLIFLIERMCKCLYSKGKRNFKLEGEDFNGSFYQVYIKKLWKLNGTIYSRDLLLEYFSNILQITEKLFAFKGIKVIQYLDSTDKLFEFYTRELKIKERNMVCLSQLYLIQHIFNTNLASEYELKDSLTKNKDPQANLVFNIFSIVLQIDRRIQDNLEDSDEVNDQILQKADSKIKLLINNKVGAQLIFQWIKNPNIGDQEIYGIKTNILIRWIIHISKQLLHPIMNENEISSRIKYLNKERIKASLLLDDSASNDTISIVISLLTFCYGYFPDQVILFILKNINREEIQDLEYSRICNVSEDIVQKINNYEKSSVFGNLSNTRNIPTRVLLYYSFMLLDNTSLNGKKNIDLFQDHSFQKDKIISKIISILVNSNLRRREWLIWHSKNFEKIEFFSNSLHNLIQARGEIGSYQEQKKIEEQIFKWIYDRSVDYSRYQVSSRPFSISSFYSGLVDFSISPILEKSILQNVSFIKFQIKQLLNLTSIKPSTCTEYELEDFIQKLSMNFNLFIFSIQSYIERNYKLDFADILTIEEVTLPLKLFLNMNSDEFDFRFKAIIGHLSLKFISVFFKPSWRESNLQELNKSDSSSQVFGIKTFTSLDSFGKSSNRKTLSLLFILVNLMDELTKWMNEIFNINNFEKFYVSAYLETFSSLVLELGIKDNILSEYMNIGSGDEKGEIFKLKIRKSLINLIQNDSTASLIEKILNYIIICRRKGNNLDADKSSYLMGIFILLLSMLLSKTKIFRANGRLESLIDSILAHPTLLFHAEKSSKCGFNARFLSDEYDNSFKDNSTTSINLCNYCLNFGFNHSIEDIKLITNVSIIVTLLRLNHANIRSISKNNLIKDIFLQSISGILNTSNKASSVSHGYMGIILMSIYLSYDQIQSLSLVHNLYIQKFLVKEFVCDILNFDKNPVENLNLSPCIVFHYSVLFSYLVFILKTTPWWLNISDLVNLTFVNKLGKIYKSLQASAIIYNDENDNIGEYLLSLTEIFLKIVQETIITRSNSSSSNIQDEKKSAESNGVIIKLIQEILKNQETENIQAYNITLVRENANLKNGNILKNTSNCRNNRESGCFICGFKYRFKCFETKE